MTNRNPQFRRSAGAVVVMLVAAGCFKGPTAPTNPTPPTPPTTPTTPVPPTPPPRVPPPVGPGNAHRMIAWASYEKLVKLNDSQLDMWKSRGVDGFVVQTRYLDEIGGSEMWTGDPNVSLSGVIIEGTDVHEKQRTLRDTRFVERCHERGMQVYLGFYLSNYHNLQTPLKVWNDDAGWAQVAALGRDIAGAAKLLGMDGLATDSEMYRDDSKQTWNWSYPGNAQSESDVRALARKRGRQFMDAVLEGFPNVEIINYRIEIPGDWEERVQAQVNKVERIWDKSVFVDFWGGIVDAGGFYAIYFLDPIFYKSWHIRSGWDEALQYNREGVRKTLSERWSNWAYASTRVFITPFAWIDPGPSPSSFDDARPPDYVAAQLDAFHRWGEGGTFGLYTQHIDDFDYTPYVAAMQKASTPDTPGVQGLSPEVEPVGGVLDVADARRGWAADRRGDGDLGPLALRLERVAEGFRGAADAAFTPDGRMFIAQQDGRIRVLRGNRVNPAPAITLDVSIGGGGLLAIAIDPEFTRTHFVYALYAALSRTGPVFRLARFREVQDTLGERAILLDDVPAVPEGAAASLRFGPDGKLYVALGAGGDARHAGSAASYNAKILRLNADGGTPADQPMASPVLSYGYDAPRGLDWQTDTGALWIAGSDGVRSGGRAVPGLATTPRAMAIYRGDLIPWLAGDLIVAGEGAPAIARVRLNRTDPGLTVAQTLLADAGGSVRALAIGPDGAIYFCVNDEVMRIVPQRSR